MSADYFKQIKLLSICFFGYLVMSVFTYVKIVDLIHLMMIWNLFLAFMPLVFSMLVDVNMRKGNKMRAIAAGVMWLLFLPNSPYMVTDFIHISGTQFYIDIANPYYYRTYNTAFMPWLKIIHIGIGMFFGIMLGMYSMYIIQKTVSANTARMKSYVLIFFCCILSGYAIFVGRFLRFNSWDIFRPVYLAVQLAKNMNWIALKFSMLFGGYVLVIYIVFYIFFNRNTNE